MSVHDPDCLTPQREGGHHEEKRLREAEPYGGWPLPEVAILLAGICAALVVAFVNDLPILLPSQKALGAFGVHYLVPVVTLIGWGLLILRNRQPRVLVYLAAAFVCYLGVLIVHFNLKLWVTAVNGANHDAAFMRSDRALQPVVDACFAVRHWLADRLGGIDVGFGVLAYLVVKEHTGDTILAGIAFSVGFVALLLARSELFTENFLVPVSAVVARMRAASTSGRSSRSTLTATKPSASCRPTSGSSKDSCAMTWHQWQAAYPTESRTGTPRRPASSASSESSSCTPWSPMLL